MKKKRKACYFFVRFPWYPFTFVSSEMTRLKREGFDLQILVLTKGSKEELHEDFQELWEDITVVRLGSRLRQLACYHYFNFFYRESTEALRKKFEPYAVDGGDLFKDDYLLPAFSVAFYLAMHGKADYMHSHFSYRDSTLAYMISQLLNIPKGLTSHADSYVTHKYKLLKEQVLDSAVVFTSTEQARQNILNICGDGSFKERVVLKKAGVNLEKFSPVTNVTDRKKLISICRFDPKKGIIYLVKACHLLLERGYDIKCVMVGDALHEPQKKILNEVLDYLKDKGIEDHFLLTGALSQEEYLKHLTGSAILVAPYIVTEKGERDGVPTVLIETMASALVPIATDAGATDELIEHMKNGLIVPQKDERALADAIGKLIEDGPFYERLRQNARKKVEAERDVKKTEDILAEYVKRITA